MGTVTCKCGKVFGDGEIPCPHEYALVADTAIDGLTERIVQTCQPGQDAEVQVTFLIKTYSTPIYKCPHCGRLLAFWNGLEQTAVFYQAE